MQKNESINLSEKIMKEISEGKVKMKPKWIFIFGSVSLAFGIFFLLVFLVFLASLASFSLKTHGPMGAIRYEELISSFPWFIVPLSAFGIIAGVYGLKKYDFSYKKNFLFIVAAGITVIFAAGFFADVLGLDRFWKNEPRMRALYEQYDGRKNGIGRYKKLEMRNKNIHNLQEAYLR